MAKSSKAFRTIREVADWLDVAAHVLRFWESKFNQIKPVKRAGGRRYYRPADMELVGGIKVLLHERGMTIRGVQKLIDDEGLEAVTSLSPPIDEMSDDASDHADVIDLDPSDAWAEDAAAEGALQAPEVEVEVEAEVTTPPEPATLPEMEKPTAPQPAPVRLDEVKTPPEAVGKNAPDPVDLPATEPEATAVDVAEPAPAPPVPAAAQSPSRALPPVQVSSDPAEGPLGKLNAIAALPVAHRATLAPQIAALAAVRNRLAAPR